MNFSQKVPLTRAQASFVRRRVLDEIQRRGRAMPCTVLEVSGAIVTVNFDVSGLTLPNVTMPLFGPEYVRYPIQPGCLGVVFPVDYYIGGISGLGSSVASDTTLRGNLSTLVFFPIGNKDWTAVDPDAVTIYGPNGVVFRDTDGNTVATLTPDGLVIDAKTDFQVQVGTGGSAPKISMTTSAITLQVGSVNLVIDSSGVKIQNKLFLSHTHSNVQPGSGTSGPVS